MLSKTRTGKLGPLLWLLCFQFFVAEQAARLHVRGPYSMPLNTISDLGAAHAFGLGAGAATSYSSWRLLMNSSFTLQGLLISGGALLAWRLYPARPLSSVAFLAFALSGVGVFVVGLIPEDVDGQMHLLAASAHFVCGSLAMLLAGFALLRTSRVGGALSIAAGTLALAATLLLGFHNTAWWGAAGWHVGTVERIAAYPLPLWLTLTGFVFLLRPPRTENIAL